MRARSAASAGRGCRCSVTSVATETARWSSCTACSERWPGNLRRARAGHLTRVCGTNHVEPAAGPAVVGRQLRPTRRFGPGTASNVRGCRSPPLRTPSGCACAWTTSPGRSAGCASPWPRSAPTSSPWRASRRSRSTWTRTSSSTAGTRSTCRRSTTQSTVSTAARCWSSRTGRSASTGRGRSGSAPRWSCGTCTTCRWPTRRESRGCARPSRRTRASRSPTPSSTTPWRSSPTGRRCWGSATSVHAPPCPSWRARRSCSRRSATSTRTRSASTCPPETSTRSWRRCSGSPRASEESTSRTSQPRTASRWSGGCVGPWTSPSSTTTSTERPSSCSRPWRTPCGSSTSGWPTCGWPSWAWVPQGRRSPRSCMPPGSATSWASTGRASCTPAAGG